MMGSCELGCNLDSNLNIPFSGSLLISKTPPPPPPRRREAATFGARTLGAFFPGAGADTTAAGAASTVFFALETDDEEELTLAGDVDEEAFDFLGDETGGVEGDLCFVGDDDDERGRDLKVKFG